MELELTDVATRLGVATLAGAVIGLNRDLANKPMGTRTLGLVSLGAAVVTLAAIQVPGMAENPDAMSRVVQGIVQGVMAGISFIGAGVILRDAQAKTIEGLTTAATVWLTAALGIACGLAAWWTVLIASAIALALLLAFRWIEKLFESIRSGAIDPDRR
jgi:putative Mg2+ transporter-C (MgtC) family protein